MPNWTKEQELAINEHGKNIIVSAGAGSGKTAVLTERVIRNIKNGISIKNMLILTFTNNAAHEMKERIRNALKKEIINNPELKDELDYIDNAYITTFDAYSLSILKKYSYILGISNDISIIDESIISLKKEEILDNIFEGKYKSNNKSFVDLVNLFCSKDDNELKNNIIDLYNKLDLLSDKSEYLNSYIDSYYNEKFINNVIKDYEKILIDKMSDVSLLFELLKNEIPEKYVEEYSNILTSLINSNDYDNIRLNSNISLSTLRGATDLGKELKTKINTIIKEINNMCYYSKEDHIKKFISTKNIVEEIISIIKELDSQLLDFKKSINKYEFKDISYMVIDIVKNNKSIRDELKNTYSEICIDEYQDTNDIQEEFINLIADNNVYMVGDIKQSIYRFRNANPSLFKEKYDSYSKGEVGLKIDLLKNFRSRNEVITSINSIFNLIMDNDIGGAVYHDTHNMVFGNTTYENEGKTNQDYNLNIYNYVYDKESKFTKTEIEAFIIANDIINKINSNYKVFDKELNSLRKSTYKDFSILIDRSTDFDLYKKIFLFLGIPTTIYKDENILNNNEIYLIKNIINIIIKIKDDNYDADFKHSFMSILRSYLIGLNDNEIFNIFKNNTFKETALYNKCLDISKYIDGINNKTLLDIIIKEFDFINNFIKVGDIEEKISVLNYLSNIFNDLDSIGYGIYELNNYLDSLIEKDKEIKVNMTSTDEDSVKIMTIHKSKGLEYNICYYSGFDKPFNIKEIKSKLLFNKDVGIIVPIYDEGIEELITKDIIKNNYVKDEISEKIRLLYVALTRAKEKMIIVGNFNEEVLSSYNNDGIVNSVIRNNYKSFKDIILSTKDKLKDNFINIDLNNLILTHDYRNIKSYNIEDNIEKNGNTINVTTNNIDTSIITDTHYSKDSLSVIDNNIHNNMLFGTHMHEIFEYTDFYNPNYNELDEKEVKYLEDFLNNELFKNIKDAKIFKEYEFIDENDNEIKHGIIDLMLLYNDHIDIIDYKLMNVTSEEYIKQLNGYKDYIEKSFNKKTNIYLYSIIKNELNKVM